MNKLSLLCVICLVLAGCTGQPSPSKPVPAPSPGAVLPLEGIQEVKLGEAQAEVEKRLGEPEERDANEFNPGNTYALYHGRGIEIGYDDGQVAMIVLHNESGPWKAYPGGTAEGLWVGSDPTTITSSLGQPPEQLSRALKYPDKGLWFRLDEQGQVESLSVYRPE